MTQTNLNKLIVTLHGESNNTGDDFTPSFVMTFEMPTDSEYPFFDRDRMEYNGTVEWAEVEGRIGGVTCLKLVHDYLDDDPLQTKWIVANRMCEFVRDYLNMIENEQSKVLCYLEHQGGHRTYRYPVGDTPWSIIKDRFVETPEQWQGSYYYSHDTGYDAWLRDLIRKNDLDKAKMFDWLMDNSNNCAEDIEDMISAEGTYRIKRGNLYKAGPLDCDVDISNTIFDVLVQETEGKVVNHFSKTEDGKIKVSPETAKECAEMREKWAEFEARAIDELVEKDQARKDAEAILNDPESEYNKMQHGKALSDEQACFSLRENMPSTERKKMLNERAKAATDALHAKAKAFNSQALGDWRKKCFVDPATLGEDELKTLEELENKVIEADPKLKKKIDGFKRTGNMRINAKTLKRWLLEIAEEESVEGTWVTPKQWAEMVDEAFQRTELIPWGSSLPL